jgi:starch phosphorylase
VLDGWWDEADYVRTGWAIGSGEEYDDPDYQDEVEANALYELIEKEVVPLFYDRDENDTPRGWVAKMKDAIYLNTPRFNTSRMVKEYARRAYFMVSDRLHQLSADQYAPAKELAAWHNRLYEHWYDIKIQAIDIAAPSELQVNETFNVQAKISLGKLSPEDVLVELYQGTVQVDGEMHTGISIAMDYQGHDTDGNSLYATEMQYVTSGLQGLSLRLLPRHRYLHSSLEMRLILWANPEEVAINMETSVDPLAPAAPATPPQS